MELLGLDMNKGVKPLSTILFFLLTFHLGISGIASAEAPKNSVARSGFVTSWDGAKIHYLEAGKISITGPHPPASILFVPGFTMPAWIWENQIAHFYASYHASELLPEKKDAFGGAEIAAGVAEVYAILGDNDRVIDVLDGLLTRPSSVTAQGLKINPIWDPVRGDPRFQALIEKYGGKA